MNTSNHRHFTGVYKKPPKIVPQNIWTCFVTQVLVLIHIDSNVYHILKPKGQNSWKNGKEQTRHRERATEQPTGRFSERCRNGGITGTEVFSKRRKMVVRAILSAPIPPQQGEGSTISYKSCNSKWRRSDKWQTMTALSSTGYQCQDFSCQTIHHRPAAGRSFLKNKPREIPLSPHSLKGNIAVPRCLKWLPDETFIMLLLTKLKSSEGRKERSRPLRVICPQYITSFDTLLGLIYYNTFNKVPPYSFPQLNPSLCRSPHSLGGLGKCK